MRLCSASSTRLKAWTTSIFTRVLHPHSKAVQRWNKFFVIACLIAIFLDPLFFLVFSVNMGHRCIFVNTTFANVVTILRSISDFIYFLHMLLQLKLAVVPASQESTITSKYLRSWFILDIFAVLPMPQIMLWLVIPHFQPKDGNANVVKNVLRVTLLLQYVPRCIRFLPLVSGHSKLGFIYETIWVNFAINLFMYFLAGHIVGACWYLFSVQRVNQCLHNICRDENNLCFPSYLDCGDGKNFKKDINRTAWIKATNASTQCLTSPTFNYGIYVNAVPITMNHSVVSKYFYSLFWGFLVNVQPSTRLNNPLTDELHVQSVHQISTLAGNLVPSLFIWEVIFTMGIIGLGLLLFALLIGNMQSFLQSLGRRQMDMQLRRYDVETWMTRRNLPDELQKKVRQAERYKWAATRGIDEKKLLGALPEDLHKSIRRELVSHYFEKVHFLRLMEDVVYDAVLERLQQKVYIEKSMIMQRGYPVERMLFIVRGKISSVGKDGTPNILTGGDFCGEESLIFFLGNINSGFGAKMRRRVFSTRDVKCLTNVEAFSLEAEDMEFIVDHFKRYMRNPKIRAAIRYESSFFKNQAARVIQSAWMRRQQNVQRRTMNGVYS